jgi:hypothetical protein
VYQSKSDLSMKFILHLFFFCLFFQENTTAGNPPIVFTSDCNPKEFCLWPNNCNFGNANLSVTAEGGCSNLSFTWQIDLANNGTFDKSGSGPTILDTFPNGTHRILWKAKDNCGQQTTCQYTIKSKDCNPPNLISLSGLTLPLQLPDCVATVLPTQFLQTANDNCTPANQIEYAIRKLGSGTGFPTTTSVAFSRCESGTNLVEIWAKDLAGNSTSFVAYVLAQNNSGNCPCIPDTVRFSGKITTPNNEPLPKTQVLVQIGGGSVGTTTPVVIDTVTGNYYFDLIAKPAPTPYTVSVIPSKLLDPVNGVNVFDIYSMTKHVLNIIPYTNMYKMISADININNQVTTSDLVEVRKLILGIYSDFPANTSWRFVQPLTDPTNLTQWADLKSFYSQDILIKEAISAPNVVNWNFIGIKIGDPTFTADPKL